MAEQVLDGLPLSRADALELTALEGPALYDMFHWANRIRRRFVGDEVSLCAIVSARSGGCTEDCKFCAQSSHHRADAPRHGLLPAAEIMKAAAACRSSRPHRFGIVTSGSSIDEGNDLDRVCDMVAQLGSAYPGLSFCGSFGHLTTDVAARLRAAGFSRVNHNLETSERFFPHVCTTHAYRDRVETVQTAKAAGLSVCCGGVFGLGESWEDRVDLALALRELDVDAVPINFLNPIRGTPLGSMERLPPLEALQIVAVFRFLLPTKEIKVCGGREATLRELQSWMFYAGANATMAGNYLTTTGRPAGVDLQMIHDLGLHLKRTAL